MHDLFMFPVLFLTGKTEVEKRAPIFIYAIFFAKKSCFRGSKADSSKLYVRFETLMEFYVYSL